jgi:tetratricopeptide (TPR) repeat protein
MHSFPTGLESPLAGRYSLEARVGAGGMGSVLRAVDLESGSEVAIKLLDVEDSAEDARIRFRHEVETLAELRHPGIVKHFAHGFSAAGRPYLVMEWIAGEHLGARIERERIGAEGLLVLLRAITAALAVAHRRGILHRDLKPSNILLRDGSLEHPVLIDFGVARRMWSTNHLTRTGALIGTPVYMAPEQARGERELSLASDVFSLGCVAFHCLIGHSPFASEQIAAVLARILFEDAPSVCELRPEIPRSIGNLIARMLDRDPGKRPPDADALHRELLDLKLDALELGAVEHPRSHVGSEPALREQQLYCVLLAVPQAEGRSEPRTLTDTLHDTEEADDPALLARSMGARAEWLANGSLVAAFSTQTSATDRAVLAARCALALRERWSDLALALATGRGQVRAGRALGEAVDRAHRLLANVVPGVVRIDELSAHLLDGRFDIVGAERELELVRESVHDWAPRQLLGKPIPCLGRAHELGLLELSLRACVDERSARLVLVSGNPGCGKSRLRHEFMRRCEAATPGLLILRGEGDPMTAGSPYAILGRAIRAVAGLDRTEHNGKRRRALAKLVADWAIADEAERSESVVDFLTELCGLPHANDPSPALRAARLDPNLMRERCLQTWLALLRALLGRQPVLLVAEDLHWGDRLTLELLLRAHEQLADAPLLIMGVARPELFDKYPELGREFERGDRRQHIRLASLGRNACTRLIHIALDGVLEPSDTLVDRLIEQASGNALYLEELIRAAANGGVNDFPTTVSAMLQARMGLLEPRARRVLLAASVLGQRFALEQLEPLLDGESTQVIEQLIEAEMLEPEHPDVLRFRHGLLRDAAYGLLSHDGARELHRIAAEHLIASDADPMIIADHLSSAGLGERAASYYLRAAEQASAANALDETLRRAEKGLACTPTGPVAAHLAAIQIWALGWLGRWDSCMSLAEATLPRLEPGSAWWSRCLAMFIGVGFLTGDEPTLARMTALLFSATPRSGALVPYLDALNVGIGSGTMIGRYGLAARYYRRAVEVAHELDDDALRLLGFGEASLALYVDLDPSATLAATETVSQLAAVIGDGRYLVFSQVCAGLCHARLGQRDRALQCIHNALEVAARLSNPYLRAYASIELASTLADQAATPEQLEQAESLASAIVDAPLIPAPYPGWARAIRARVLLVRGQVEAAAHEAGEALRRLSGAPRLQCRAWLDLALARRAQGNLELASEAADAALDLIEGEGGWERLEALRACASLRNAIGDHAGAKLAASELARRRAVLLGRIEDPASRQAVEQALTPA